MESKDGQHLSRASRVCRDALGGHDKLSKVWMLPADTLRRADRGKFIAEANGVMLVIGKQP